MAPMVNNVVRDVLMERANVWLMLLLMRSAVWFLLNAPLFSRIRSKITMVEFTEYPRIVKSTAIKALFTGIRKIAYAARTTSTS